MRKSSINLARLVGLLLLAVYPASSLLAQQPQAGEPDKVKPVTLRIGVPNKQSERDVVFSLIVETSGAASVGRIRAELELSAMDGWSFRNIEQTRGLNLRSTAKKRNQGAGTLVIDWDISAEGNELPTGHVALLRVQADKNSKSPGPASDNPPTLVVRKMSWGLAEFEKPPEGLPQLETPDNLTGNPDVSCFFFTH
ncbi:MAG: hypothetical protein EXQ56_03465 [Acidobacteria bacterium]|nr:hypothetical protein [Acidobacteriota bacterium]